MIAMGATHCQMANGIIKIGQRSTPTIENHSAAKGCRLLCGVSRNDITAVDYVFCNIFLSGQSSATICGLGIFPAGFSHHGNSRYVFMGTGCHGDYSCGNYEGITGIQRILCTVPSHGRCAAKLSELLTCGAQYLTLRHAFEENCSRNPTNISMRWY